MLTTRKFDKAKAAERAAYQRYAQVLDARYVADRALYDAMIARDVGAPDDFDLNMAVVDRRREARAAHQAVADALDGIDAAKQARIAAHYSTEPDRVYPT